MSVLLSVKSKAFYKCIPDLQNCVAGDICHKYINMLAINECPLPVLVECDYGKVCCPFKWRTNTCKKEKPKVSKGNSSTSLGKKSNINDEEKPTVLTTDSVIKPPNSSSSSGKKPKVFNTTLNKPTDSSRNKNKYCVNSF